MFCREWLAQLERQHPELRAAGLRAVAVGIGEVKHARRYCPALAPSLECVVGEGSQTHRAYCLKRGSLLQLAGPLTVAAAVRATAQGHTQGAATGDGAMLPGAFIVDRDGIIRYAHYGRHAGDHPDLIEALEALAAAVQ
jgi:hypothetical protein